MSNDKHLAVDLFQLMIILAGIVGVTVALSNMAGCLRDVGVEQRIQQTEQHRLKYEFELKRLELEQVINEANK